MEHAVDELRHLDITQTVVGPGNLHQGPQHLRQFALIDDAVAIVVAHVEDDPQLVFGASFGEEDDRIEKLLERDATVAVLIDDVEHHFHENVVAFHAQGAGEFVARKRRSHDHDDVTGHVFQLALLARFQAERQGVGLAEEVFQSLFAALARLGIGEHLLAVGGDLFQLLLVTREEVFQFVQKPASGRQKKTNTLYFQCSA